jgi:hypothetical protein
LQLLPECSHTRLTLWIVCGPVDERADPAHLLGLLLCAHHEWPFGGSAAYKRDEIAPPCMSGKQHIEG